MSKILKGKWRWNDHPNPASNEISCAGITFSTIYKGFSGGELTIYDYYGFYVSTDGTISYLNSTNYEQAYIGYNWRTYNETFTVYTIYQEIDFGGGVEVTDEFYEYFTENAIRFETISGTWRLNTATAPVSLEYAHTYTILPLIFHLSTGESYCGIGQRVGSSEYPLCFILDEETGDYTDVYYNGSWAINNIVIYIDPKNQEVSPEFYEWLMSNAVQIDDGSNIIILMDKNELTLATENTIVDRNIRVRVDESLLGGESGLPIETNDLDATLAAATEADIGKIYKYTGDTNATYTNGSLYTIE